MSFLSTSTPSLAVMSDATQPGATAFTCKTSWVLLYVFSWHDSTSQLLQSTDRILSSSTRIDVSAGVLPGHGSAVVGLSDVADDPGD
jgi:hypothetical protein